MLFSMTEHFTKTDRHGSFYLACRPETGQLIIFIHGWPELFGRRPSYFPAAPIPA
jgi:hypothetical protein